LTRHSFVKLFLASHPSNSGFSLYKSAFSHSKKSLSKPQKKPFKSIVQNLHANACYTKRSHKKQQASFALGTQELSFEHSFLCFISLEEGISRFKMQAFKKINHAISLSNQNLTFPLILFRMILTLRLQFNFAGFDKYPLKALFLSFLILFLVVISGASPFWECPLVIFSETDVLPTEIALTYHVGSESSDISGLFGRLMSNWTY